MPRLPFALETALQPEPDDLLVEVVAPVAQVDAWAAAQPPVSAGVRHRAAGRGLPQPEDGPVRGVEGWAVHRIRVVSPAELTCTVCGETSLDGVCWRCGKRWEPAHTPMIPTISYLRPDEYELIMRSSPQPARPPEAAHALD